MMNDSNFCFLVSAYCGSLTVAALRACVEMAKLMNDDIALQEYQPWLTLARKSFNEKLWNGKNQIKTVMNFVELSFFFIREIL